MHLIISVNWQTKYTLYFKIWLVCCCFNIKNVKKHKQERNKIGTVMDSLNGKSVIWLKMVTGCMNLIAIHVNEGGMC